MSVFRLLTITLSGCAILGSALVVSTGAVVDQIVVERASNIDKKYPEFSRLGDPDLKQSIEIKYRNGNIIGIIGPKNRQSVKLSGISPIAIDAFISAEDKNFWKEPGIAPAAIFRSAIRDAFHPGHRPTGASTIPQQVVKNIVMHNPTMTIKRKIDEAILALRAVSKYGKKPLLQLYLNEIYLGHGAYGIAAAAKTYFNVKPDQLTVAEAAMLGGLPKAPTSYDPIAHPNAARERRAYVIAQMLKDGYINSSQAQKALASPVIPTTNNTSAVDPSATTQVSSSAQGWALEAVVTQWNALGINPPTGYPIQIRTTISEHLQDLAQHALQAGLTRWSMHLGWKGSIGRGGFTQVARPDNIPFWLHRVRITSIGSGKIHGTTKDGASIILNEPDRLRKNSQWPRIGDMILAGPYMPGQKWQIGQSTRLNGSIVVINPKNAHVLAISGGNIYSPGGFNRAIDAVRQPGSSFKPFIYLTAAMLGYKSDTPMLDEPIALSQGPGLPLWKPGDDGLPPMGVVTFRKALSLSLNDAAVRLLYEVGRKNVSQVASALDIYHDVKTYTAALGGQGVTNIRLTGAYACLANEGYWAAPTTIKIITQNKNHLWAAQVPVQIIPQKAIDTVDKAMTGTIAYGTAHAIADLAQKYPGLGGKTGTSQNYRDAWFEGIWPGHFAIGVQIGYDQPKSMGHDAYGADVALPVFKDFVTSAFQEENQKNNHK